MEIHRVYEKNFDELKAQIAKLNKRAAKLGVPAITLTVTGQEEEPIIKNGTDTGRVRRVVLVTVQGQSPKLAGYSLLGVIEPVVDEHGNVIGNQTRSVPGQAIPEQYRHASLVCDHCHTARYRREVFIVQNEEGATKQVGRQCLADFLGHQSPEHFIALAGIIRSIGDALSEAEEYDGGFGGGSDRYELREFLARTSRVIRTDGWTPRSRASDLQGATVDVVLNTYTPEAEEWFTFPVEGDEDYQRSEATLVWLEELHQGEQVNDYLYNLSLLGGSHSVTPKQAGLAASAIAAWLRAQGKEAERKERAERAATSQYFGTVGKREVFTLKLEYTRLIPSDYGESILHKFSDDQGNIATWFSSCGQICELGQSVKVKATVKAHQEYQGSKQTLINRLKEV